jgi:hypothetical protein
LPDQVMKKPFAVPLHEAVQCGVVPIDEPLHVRRVKLLGACSLRS